MVAPIREPTLPECMHSIEYHFHSKQKALQIVNAACTFTRHVKPRNYQNGAGSIRATSQHFSYVPDFRTQVVVASRHWASIAMFFFILAKPFFRVRLWMKCICFFSSDTFSMQIQFAQLRKNGQRTPCMCSCVCMCVNAARSGWLHDQGARVAWLATIVLEIVISHGSHQTFEGRSIWYECFVFSRLPLFVRLISPIISTSHAYASIAFFDSRPREEKTSTW